MRKVHIFLSALAVLISSYVSPLSWSAQNSESITITTYYPSPVGVYRMIRLFPINNEKNMPPCEENREGFLYYNDIEGDENQHQLMLCRETLAETFQWCPVGRYIPPQQGGSAEVTVTKMQQRLSTIEEEIAQIMHLFKARKISEDKARAMLRVLAKEELTLESTLDYQTEQMVDSFFRNIKP